MESDALNSPDTALAQTSPRRLTGYVVGGYRLAHNLGLWSMGAVYVGDRVAREGSLPETALVELLGASWHFNHEECVDVGRAFSGKRRSCNAFPIRTFFACSRMGRWVASRT
jgi:hypothetical protein